MQSAMIWGSKFRKHCMSLRDGQTHIGILHILRSLVDLTGFSPVVPKLTRS